ncbi:MAG: sigma-70 family RNA polymerase sigma factor [Bacteroidales bacterium]|nr:sigma-70 family RNA polymerase sigma factor [Bacteroidales bacterium]
MALKFFRASHLDGDPEDVVQDVLLRLWVARRDGTKVRSAEAWAVTATKNACISLWRKNRQGRSGEFPEWLTDYKDASASLELSETERIAEKAMERLPAGTQRLLQLRATGLSLDEIASITGRTKGGVKSSISAARHEFMKSFDPK